MKCDERGTLYSTGPGGIWAIGSDGEHLGTIETPEAASNLCFGGSDWRTLYITASRSVYRVPMKVRGAPVPHIADQITRRAGVGGHATSRRSRLSRDERGPRQRAGHRAGAYPSSRSTRSTTSSTAATSSSVHCRGPGA